MATISGVLFYTCIQQPSFKYKDTVNKEFKVSVCISEDEADTWDDQFPKQAAKTIKTADFEQLYGVEPPFPEQRKQYLVTLKRDAQYRDGNPIADAIKPKVYVKNPDTGKNVDVTATKLVGNGSFGVVSYDVVDNDYGTFAKLRNVRVDKLIEYKMRGAGDDELGEVEDTPDEFDSDSPAKAAQAEAPKTKAQESKKEVAKAKTTSRPARTESTGNSVADLEDDESPF